MWKEPVSEPVRWSRGRTRDRLRSKRSCAVFRAFDGLTGSAARARTPFRRIVRSSWSSATPGVQRRDSHPSPLLAHRLQESFSSLLARRERPPRPGDRVHPRDTDGRAEEPQNRCHRRNRPEEVPGDRVRGWDLVSRRVEGYGRADSRRSPVPHRLTGSGAERVFRRLGEDGVARRRHGLALDRGEKLFVARSQSRTNLYAELRLELLGVAPEPCRTLLLSSSCGDSAQARHAIARQPATVDVPSVAERSAVRGSGGVQPGRGKLADRRGCGGKQSRRSDLRSSARARRSREQLASTFRVAALVRDRSEQLDAPFHAELVPQFTMDRQRFLEAPAGALRVGRSP